MPGLTGSTRKYILEKQTSKSVLNGQIVEQDILATQLVLLSVCRLENRKRTCKKKKNNLGIANQVRSDVLAARILRTVEKTRVRLENVCPSCMTDVGEDVIICFFSFFL